MARRSVWPWVWWGGLVLAVCAAAAWRLWPPGAVPERPSTPADAAPTRAAESLPDADRAYIWDIEHQGLVLKKYGFGSMKAALRDANASALLDLLAADFRGEVLGNPREIALSSPAVEAMRQEEVAGRPRQTLGREPFVNRLMEYRRRFVAPPGIDMALMTLSPESPADVNGPWMGEVQLRMWGGMGQKGEGPDELVRAASLVGRAGRPRRPADADAAGRGRSYVAVPHRPPLARKPLHRRMAARLLRPPVGFLRGAALPLQRRDGRARRRRRSLLRQLDARRKTSNHDPRRRLSHGLRPRRLPRHADHRRQPRRPLQGFARRPIR